MTLIFIGTTNYNHERLQSLDRTNVLPDGVSPSKVVPSRVSIKETTPLFFGFGYYDQVLHEFNEHVEDEALEALERGAILNGLDFDDDEDTLPDLEDDEDKDDSDNDNNEEEMDVEDSNNADDVAHLTMPLTRDIPAD